MEEKRELVDRSPEQKISVRKQCKILGISRSGLYHKPKGESALNLELLRLMDEFYLNHSDYGSQRMYIWLKKDKGYKISRKRVNRLYYEVLGLRSILPGPHTSKPGKGKGHQVFPYLLRGLKIERPNQVWATDITYIPMPKGFMYLVAFIDLYSRSVVGWSVSNTMDSAWCKATFLKAVAEHGKPDILNTDQGRQYTSKAFVKAVLGEKVRLSMDGKGRCIDNVFVERLWRSVKYEDVYVKEYRDGHELEKGLEKYFLWYNERRRHQGIGYEIPLQRYLRKVGNSISN